MQAKRDLEEHAMGLTGEVAKELDMETLEDEKYYGHGQGYGGRYHRCCYHRRCYRHRCYLPPRGHGHGHHHCHHPHC